MNVVLSIVRGWEMLNKKIVLFGLFCILSHEIRSMDLGENCFFMDDSAVERSLMPDPGELVVNTAVSASNAPQIASPVVMAVSCMRRSTASRVGASANACVDAEMNTVMGSSSQGKPLSLRLNLMKIRWNSIKKMRQFTCEVCGKCYVCKKYFLQHKKIHENKMAISFLLNPI